MPAPVAPTPSAQPQELDAVGELNRQVGVLVERGYPELVGLSPDAFVEALAPLAERAQALTLTPQDGTGLPPGSTEIGRASCRERVF